MANPLRAFADERTVVLTTFRRDGRAVPTAMSVVLDGDRAFMRTWSTSGKMKRLRRNPVATIAPSTTRGRPTGPATTVRAVVVTGPDAARASTLLARKHPVLHGLAVPVAHRVTRRHPVYLELLPEPAEHTAEDALEPVARAS
jgi:PPOX class probable F420-dependent enzyme